MCSRVHTFSLLGASMDHGFIISFSASIRTAGALLLSTDFIGITDIVNDILRGEHTEPLYKEQKENKKRQKCRSSSTTSVGNFYNNIIFVNLR